MVASVVARIPNGPCLAFRDSETRETRGSLTLDGQVLVVAFLALSLNFVVWGAGQDVVQAKEELHRKDEFNLGFDRPRHSKVDKQ